MCGQGQQEKATKSFNVLQLYSTDTVMVVVLKCHLESDSVFHGQLAMASWPDLFPDFVGLDFFPVNSAHNGHGEQVWQIEIIGSSMQITGNSATFQYKFSVIEVPEDGDQSFTDGYTLTKASAQIDVAQKAFRVDGGLELIESTMPPGSYNLKGLNWEFLLNSDNTLITKVDTSWAGHKSLLFVKPKTSLVPHLAPSGLAMIQDKIKAARRFMSECDLVEAQAERVVRIKMDDIRIGKLATQEEMFEADVKFTLSWLITRDELYQRIVKPHDWLPSWCPPAPAVLNSHQEGSVAITCKPVVLHKNGREVTLSQAWSIRGSFHETLELDNYPFDCQPLHVHFAFSAPDGESITWEHGECEKLLGIDTDAGNESPIRVMLARAVVRQESRSSRSFELEMLEPTSKVHCCVGVVVKRKATMYWVRIILVQLLINILSLTIFSIDPVDDKADRLNVILVVLLVAAAYSQITASMLPSLGYMTLIDRYIFESLLFMSGLCLQVAFIGDVETDQICMWADAVMMILWHLYKALRIFVWIIPRESRKGLELNWSGKPKTSGRRQLSGSAKRWSRLESQPIKDSE